MDDATARPSAQTGPDRFLIGIVVGLAVLVLAAAISVLFLRQPAPQLPANTPGGTVQRFFAALEQKDYGGAYKYLSDSMTNKPTQDQFVSYQANGLGGSNNGQRIRIQNEDATGSKATVTVQTTSFYDSGGLFGGSGSYSSTEVFTLGKEGDTWRITVLPPEYLPFSNR